METMAAPIKQDDYVKPMIEALAKYLEIETEDIDVLKYDHYGLLMVKADGAEYAIGDDSECDEACQEYVEQSVWAFNASFILNECELPYQLEDAIKSFQESECEGANDALLALVEKCSSLESFTESAIGADGRGHFLSGYDGNEIDLEGGFYAYRAN